MLKFMFLLSILAVSDADNNPCCIPHQFRGGMLQLGGYMENNAPNLINVANKIHFDYNSKKIRLDVYVSSTFDNVQVIYDFNVNRTYSYYKGSCNVTQSPMVFPNICIPDQASLISTGFLAHDRIPIKTFQWYDAKNNQSVVATVTSDACIPISETLIGGPHNGQTLETNIFADMTTDAVKIGAFDVHPECLNQPVQQAGHKGKRTSVFIDI